MRCYLLIFTILLLFSCSGFEPLYKENKNLNHSLKGVVINTDKRKMSLDIKKNLLRKMPSDGNRIDHIIKIETDIENNSTVTSTDRKTSGYEIVTTSKVSLYKREKKIDKKVLSFEEKNVGLFEFSPNQVLSTLASRDRTLAISAENLSESILNRIMLYFVDKANDNKK